MRAACPEELVPPKYSIAWLICAVTCGREAVMVGWPGAAQDHLPDSPPYSRPRRPGALQDLAKEAELLVLRHENAMLRRHAGRIRYEPADRVWFTALTRLIPRERWAGVFPVTPATLLAWHRRLAARKYDTSRQRKPGRPPAIRSIARLAVRLAKENPRWAYRRIHGELTKLGVTIAPSTVYEILRAEGIGPAPRRAARRGGSSCTPRPPGSSQSTSCTSTPCC